MIIFKRLFPKLVTVQHHHSSAPYNDYNWLTCYILQTIHSWQHSISNLNMLRTTLIADKANSY